MPNLSPQSPPSPLPLSRPTASAWLFWLLLQLLALAISAGRFPLTARFPQNGEQFALAVMLVTQILTISMLCPLLARDLRSTIATLIIAWPMAELAAFLADASLPRAALAEAYVSLWAISLMLWIKTARTDPAKLLTSAAATLLAVAGPLLWYLHAEFVTESTDVNWPHIAPLGPIMGALSQIIPDQATSIAWYFVGTVLITGAMAVMITSRIRSAKARRRNYSTALE